jgi:hypothetical protein
MSMEEIPEEIFIMSPFHQEVAEDIPPPPLSLPHVSNNPTQIYVMYKIANVLYVLPRVQIENDWKSSGFGLTSQEITEKHKVPFFERFTGCGDTFDDTFSCLQSHFSYLVDKNIIKSFIIVDEIL